MHSAHWGVSQGHWGALGCVMRHWGHWEHWEHREHRALYQGAAELRLAVWPAGGAPAAVSPPIAPPTPRPLPAHPSPHTARRPPPPPHIPLRRRAARWPRPPSLYALPLCANEGGCRSRSQPAPRRGKMAAHVALAVSRAVRWAVRAAAAGPLLPGPGEALLRGGEAAGAVRRRGPRRRARF